MNRAAAVVVTVCLMPTSGPSGLIAYHSQRASECELTAATTERPVLFQEGHTTSPWAQSRPAPETLAGLLQKRYQGIRDFSADFVHTYRGGVLRTQSTERGTVAIKKPGLMRWIYTSPEKKEFVSDGQKIYSYLPEDRQVVVASAPSDNQASTPALFLAGKGDISRDFTAAYAESSAAGASALKLTPRRAEAEYEFLIVAIDPATLQIRALTTRDRQGGDSTLTFANLKENQGISDKTFVFRIPRGVDVITGDATRN